MLRLFKITQPHFKRGYFICFLSKLYLHRNSFIHANIKLVGESTTRINGREKTN
jgi:hypothetical protein